MEEFKLRDLFKRLLKGSIIYGLGDLLIKSGSFLLIPIYTRYLSPADYGILSSVSMFSVVMSSLLILSLNGAIVKFHFEMNGTEEQQTLYGSLFLFNLAWATIVIVGVNLIGGICLNNLFKSVRFDPYLRIGTWIVFFTSISALPLAVLQVQQKPGQYRVFTTASFILTTALILYLLVIQKKGTIGYLYGQAISGLCMAIIYIYFMSKNVRIENMIKYVKPALLYSLPLVVYTIGGWVTDVSSRYFVERYASLSALGIYSLSYQYAMIVGMIFGAINMAWIPLFFETDKNQEAAATEIYAYYSLILIAVFLLITLIIIVWAKEVFLILVSPAFYPAVELTPILVFSVLQGTVFWTILANPLFLKKKTKHLAWLTLVSGVLCITLNLALTPRWGVWGAAYATLISSIILNVLVFIISIKIYTVPHHYRKMAVLIVAVVILSLLGFYLPIASNITTMIEKIFIIAMFVSLAIKIVDYQALMQSVKCRRS
jgi:O-antigen/teichoic acid export membrane protein